jgi:hypothetical protein
MKLDSNKFSLAQMTSNSDGKTSGSGTMGVLICTVGSLCFLLGCIDKIFLTKEIDVITQSIVFVGIGAALLGYRKSKDVPGSLEPEAPVELPTTSCETCSKESCECKSLNS